MRLDLTEDESFFRETVARFLDNEAAPSTLRELRDDPVGHTAAYWRQAAELGWTSLLVAEADGGGSVSGSGLEDLVLVAHEVGAHAGPGPLLPSAVVAGALSRAGGHRDALDELLAGVATAAWAFTEAPPNDGLTLGATTIEIDGDEVVITGSKRPIESAGAAGHLLVSGRTGSGVSQVLVPAGTAGVNVRPMRTVDLTRRFDLVEFDAVRLPSSALVGELGGAADAVTTQLLQASVILAAESVGAMQKAFDITVEWAFDRYSFGRPLASYQALKARYADMTAWLHAAHGLADDAAAAVSNGDPSAARFVSAARAFIGEYGSELIQDCVQLHGGIGVTFEHDIHLYLRRHTVNRSLFGGVGDHLRAVADLITEGAAS